MWMYQAKPIRVIDGDTIEVEIDAGFRNYRIERLRLLGVNTPEKKGETLIAGRKAQAFTTNWLYETVNKDNEWPLVVKTEKSDVFGRYLAIVWRIHDFDETLNQALVNSGNAVEDIR